MSPAARVLQYRPQPDDRRHVYACPNHRTAHALLDCPRCRAIVEAHRARLRAFDLAKKGRPS